MTPLNYLFISFFLLVSSFTFAQKIENNTEKKQRITRLEGGISVGGSGSVYFFTYNSGSNFQAMHGVQLTDQSAVLLGIGVEKYVIGTLLPLTVQVDQNLGRRNRQIFKIHGGHAFEFSNNADTNYQQKGGLAAGIDYGWYLFKRPKMRLYTTFGYRFRRTVLVYKPFANNPEIRNYTNNHLIGINGGVEF